MDQSFACPECGATVEVKGLAPGRQVRCGFCRRLLEVPFLPRFELPAWKRTRFGRPWWVPWAWGGLGLALVAVVLAATVRFVGRQEEALRERAIQRLLDSSESHRRSGRFGQALVDLDGALDLYARGCPGGDTVLAELRGQRGELARQEALAVSEGLSKHESPTFPLGPWLTLQARATSDRDLASVGKELADRFQRQLQGHIRAELAAAAAAFDEARPAQAHDKCASLGKLIEHAAPPTRQELRSAADDLDARIIDRHGLLVEPPRGHFLPGSEARYRATLPTLLAEGLKARGYLPRVDDGTVGAAWSRAPYRLSVVLNERHEGYYLRSENRMTHIDAQLALTVRGKEMTRSMLSAKTAEPLPRIPAYVSSRLALSSDRIDELERLLYDNARGTIDDRIVHTLARMPACAQPSAQAGL
jgi:hypothetical protein